MAGLTAMPPPGAGAGAPRVVEFPGPGACADALVLGLGLEAVVKFDGPGARADTLGLRLGLDEFLGLAAGLSEVALTAAPLHS